MTKIAIVGAGGMGHVHARHYKRVEGVTIGVCDHDPARAQKMASDLELSPLASFQDALAWADAIDLCVPNDVHARLALEALDKGLHTFVEKPLATNVQDGIEVVELAESKGLQLMVGHVVRFFPEYRKAHDIVQTGTLGKIASVRMRRGGGLPRTEWFLDHSRSGGVLVDLAAHEYDWLLWTLGPASHLFARSVATKTDVGPDYGLCTITFKSGAVAHVEATWMDPSGFRTHFEICGSDGMIQHDSRRSASLTSFSDGGTYRYESPLVADDDPYYLQLRAFAHAIKTGTVVPVTGRDGLAALTVAMAARESAKTGQVIHF